MAERRTGNDRRSWKKTQNVVYPFFDSDGTVVERDRRVTPDRRLNNIEVQWLPMPARQIIA